MQEALRRNQHGNYADGGIRPPDQEGFDRKVALTFDDGPDLETTPAILELLEKHDIDATFFVHGEQLDVEGARELIDDMVEQGHLIGNHTESHVLIGDGPRSQPDQAEAQIEETHQRLEGVGDPGEPEFLRFPGGDASPESIRLAEERGYAVTGWHVDSSDWCFDETAERYPDRAGTCDPRVFQWHVGDRSDFSGSVVEQAERFDGGILLFHDTRGFTVEHLEEVIIALDEAGFTFTNLDDEDTFPLLHAQARAVAKQADESEEE